MPRAQLAEYLKALKTFPREESETGDLFGFDDSALQTAEKLAKLAAKHIREVHEKVLAARSAIKNPDAAAKLGVKVGKSADKLLSQALAEEQRWEKWYTDPEISAQLRQEAGITEETGDAAAAETPAAERSTEGAAVERMGTVPPSPRLRRTGETEVVAEQGTDPGAGENGNHFDPESETPLLTEKEDADDFQLVDETAEEARKRDAAAEKAEQRAVERQAEAAKRETGDLFGAERSETEETERAKVPTGYKTFDKDGNWKLDRSLGELQDAYIAALNDGRHLRIETPKGTAHIMKSGEGFHVEGVDGKIRNWGESAVRDMLARFITSPNPKISIAEESPSEHFANRRIVRDGSLLRVGDRAAFGQTEEHPALYTGEVVSIGKKNVKLKTQSDMYGEQVLTLPWSDYKAHYPKSAVELSGAELDRFKNEHGGYTPEQFDQAKVSFMEQHLLREEKPEREITSGTYERSQKRLQQKVESTFAGRQFSERRKYSASPDDVMNFRRAIESFKAGTLNRRDLITVTSHTPSVFIGLKLGDRGFRVFDRKITIPYSVIEKAIGEQVSTSTGEGHLLDLEELKNLPELLNNPIMILDSDKDNSLEVYVELTDKNNKPVMIALRVDEKIEREGRRKSEYVVNSIRSVFGKDNENTPINRLRAGHGRYVNLQKATSWFTAFGVQFPVASEIQLVSPYTIIDLSQNTTPADEKSAKKMDEDGAWNTGNTENTAAGETDAETKNGRQHSLRERKHQQINPIISNGQVRAEYQDLLDNKEYTAESIPEWEQKAIEWITRHGGVQPAAKLIAEGTAPIERHVATLVRRHLMEKAIYNSLPEEVRKEVYAQYANTGTDWSHEGHSRRLAALTLDSIEKVRAFFQNLHDNMPDEERVKLRNDVLDRTGVDVFDLPDDIVNNKHKLDEVLRAELAHKSKWYDKAYEYWINAILSAPHTHAANIIGNTANASYELGPKRFAEAAINAIARRKDGATFGEFRAMWKALDVKTAWRNALDAFDLETLSPEGKFRENSTVAIPGKIGRAIRLPGRLLVMADRFGRELLTPAETAARAYREAKTKGLTGKAMQDYVRAQMSNPASTAAQAAKSSVDQILFQEDPGAIVEKLVAMKNGSGPGAWILKFALPFMRTPANILKQGIRKGPLGTLQFGIETAQA